MYTKKIEDFEKCLSEISMERDIKEELEEVCTRMNDNEELKVRYYDFLEETRALNEAIIRDEKRRARKDGLAEGRAEGIAKGKAEGKAEGRSETQREVILNMYKDNLDLTTIAKYAGITVEKVKKIINSI